MHDGPLVLLVFSLVIAGGFLWSGFGGPHDF